MKQKPSKNPLPVYPVTFHPLALVLFDPMRERRQLAAYSNWLVSIGPDGTTSRTYGGES